MTGHISGFTFIHNGVDAGYPFVEAIRAVQPFVDEIVVVDMASTDETRQVLDRLGVRVLETSWAPGTAGAQLQRAHAMHAECEGKWVWHFEADEVYDMSLAYAIASTLSEIVGGAISEDLVANGMLVYRLQVEQNFQRVRWYPELVHRVFRKGTVEKNGHTTQVHKSLGDALGGRGLIVGQDQGFLWDVTNCFRQDWMRRCEQQAELWGQHPVLYRRVGLHSTEGFQTTERPEVAAQWLREPHWAWRASPCLLPPILVPLVGELSYRTHLVQTGLLE